MYKCPDCGGKIVKTKKMHKIKVELSKKAQKELDEISKKVRKDLKPMYDKLGVDTDKEELHWTDGEVFVINKKTRKRRELKQSQADLNKELMTNALELAKKNKKQS